MSWRNIKSRDLRGIVGKLNLEERKQKRAKHPTYWYYLDGRKQHMIKLPNIHGGSGSISTGFLQNIRNQLMLTNDQFVDLVNCPLSSEEYEQIIRERTES